MYCPGGNATDPIWRVLTSSDGISPWTPLKPQHSNPNPNRLANQLWCIDFLTPPTPIIIYHRLPAFLESLMPLKNWFPIHARCYWIFKTILNVQTKKVWKLIEVTTYSILHIYHCRYRHPRKDCFIISQHFSMVGWLVVWVSLHINLCRLVNAKSIFMQMISSISNNSVYHEYSLIVKTISISSYSV